MPCSGTRSPWQNIDKPQDRKQHVQSRAVLFKLHRLPFSVIMADPYSRVSADSDKNKDPEVARVAVNVLKVGFLKKQGRIMHTWKTR